MTNLEKFQQVFGITIDDRYIRCLGGQCKILDFIDPTVYKCEFPGTCYECPLYKFWDKEYAKNDEEATYTYGTEFVKETIKHAEKKKPTSNDSPAEDFWW